MFSTLKRIDLWVISLIPQEAKDWYYDVLKKHYIWQPDVFLWIIIFLIGYRLLNPILWIFFQSRIVDGILSKFCFQPLSFFTLLLLFFTVLWLGSYLRQSVFKNGYKTRLFNYFLLVFIIVEYWINRWDYIHFPLYSAKLFKYTVGLADPIAIFISILAIILTINLFRHNKYETVINIFTEDLPIEEIVKDGFFRTEYFTHIQKTIKDIKFDSSKAF